MVAKTISLDDTSHFNNGVQSMRGAIDTTRTLTFATTVELDDYTQGSPDEAAIDVWGRPLYVPNSSVPEGSVDTRA